MLAPSKERVTTGRVHHVGTLKGCAKRLNQRRKTDLVLADIGRIIRVLKEHVSNAARSLVMLVWRGETVDLQPLRGTTDLPGGDTRNAVSLEIVRVDRGEQQVRGVDVEGLTAEGQ